MSNIVAAKNELAAASQEIDRLKKLLSDCYFIAVLGRILTAQRSKVLPNHTH